jgi:hypothetical protein
MYCTQCGTRNDDGAPRCGNCGEPLPQPAGGPWPESIRNYLAEAIVVTLCCCVPFGIPAIVFAAQVGSKLAAGDVEGALVSSRRARTWCWVALVGGGLVCLFYVVLGLLGTLK